MRKYLLFPGTYKTKLGYTLSSHASSMIQEYNLDPKECFIIPDGWTAEQCGYNSDDYICIMATPYNTPMPAEKGLPLELIKEWHCYDPNQPYVAISPI